MIEHSAQAAMPAGADIHPFSAGVTHYNHTVTNPSGDCLDFKDREFGYKG